jgi:hypothetical protein
MRGAAPPVTRLVWWFCIGTAGEALLFAVFLGPR